MNIADKPEFDAMLAELANVFNISSQRLERAQDTYFRYLSDASWPKIKSAMLLAIRTRDAFPSIAAIRQLAGLSNMERCQHCIGNDRISHVKGLFLRFLEEEMQSIDIALERIYGHCRTNYGASPEIRLWCKQAICEKHGWSALPPRFQKPDQAAEILAGLAQMGGESECG